MNSQTPRFRLFTTQNSPFSRKAVLVLKSLGVAFTEIVEDPDAPSEAFAALGPARRFPILVDDITGAGKLAY